MIKLSNFLLVLACVFGAAYSMNAQGNQDDNFIFRVTGANGTILEYSQVACEINGTDAWAGSIDAEFCAPIVWAYDITPDSICCDSIANDYTGKIVALSRGVCEFGQKALWAQKAGAIGVIVFNHNLTATEDACTVLNMGEGAVGAGVTIPMVFGSRTVRDQMTPLINAGNAEACFLLPRSFQGYAAYHYATPVSQVDSLGSIGCRFINREVDPITDLVMKADISGPSGYSYSYSTAMPELLPGEEVFLAMDPYLPPAVLGEYTVLLTNNKYNEKRDSLSRTFKITEYTFATDNLNLQLDGGADRNDLFITGDKPFNYQIGGLALTGPNGGVATHATFGIANIDSVYSGNPSNDIIAVLLLDGDSDGDGVINLMGTGGSWDDINADLVGYANYTMVGNETEDNLIDVTLEEINNGGPITLKPSHPYYITVLYDGINNGSGRNVALSNSAHVDYLVFPTTAMYLGQFYNSAWGDRSVVHRLQLEGFVPGSGAAEPNKLDASKINVTPNPANEYVNLELKLDAVNPSVAVSILDTKGRMVTGTQVEKNIQNGVMTLNVNTLPAGVYYLWVRTAEGATMQKIVVAH
jgi:hypothetical protein